MIYGTRAALGHRDAVLVPGLAGEVQDHHHRVALTVAAHEGDGVVAGVVPDQPLEATLRKTLSRADLYVLIHHVENVKDITWELVAVPAEFKKLWTKGNLIDVRSPVH